MSTISGSSPAPLPSIPDEHVTVIPDSRLKEIAAELPGSKAAEAAARAAAAEAGIEYVPMKGSREQIIARLARFDWTPRPEDVAAASAAVIAAKPENLAKNETVSSQVYFTAPCTDMKTAANTDMYKALIDQINGSNKIHASLYGIDSVPELVDALRAAKARGAEIKIAVDQNPDGTFTYPDTEKLVAEFGPENFRVERNSKYAIMHDKFWVFDDKKVWTGSTNINSTAVGKGYNNEISVLVQSGNLARTFEAEHAQMWAGSFHSRKTDNNEELLPSAADGSSIEAYFSPKDNAIEQGILPAVKSAQTSMHLSLFHFSDVKLAQAMIDAKNRGVDVKLIIDASGAANAATHANIELLRAAGIPVKVENWGGKQHMKGGVIDGNTSIIGSMNWTNSGLKKNDENVLVMKNNAGVGGKLEEQFQSSFSSLPDLTLFGYFAAEGLNSISTMIDGNDNDHFGGKDPFLSWTNYSKALGEIDTAATKMAAVQGPDAALRAKVQALQILQGEVNKAKPRLVGGQGGTKAGLVINKIDADINGKISKPAL